MLAAETRTMYLKAKDNLVCSLEYFVPESTKMKLQSMSKEDQENQRGCYSIRQLSLLRSRMRADLEVYGKPYLKELDEDDRAFLTECRQKLWQKPWTTA